MLFDTLLQRRKRQSRRIPRRQSRPGLLLEWLEPRNLLSILNVNTDTMDTASIETSIAVNPMNPNNLIGSAGDYQAFLDAQGQLHVTDYSRAHVTFDGGHNWKVVVIPFNTSLYTFTGDPGVAFDAGRHRLYIHPGHLSLGERPVKSQ
jgi:hypothetical protein